MHWCGEAHLWSLMITDSGRGHDGGGGKNESRKGNDRN